MRLHSRILAALLLLAPTVAAQKPAPQTPDGSSPPRARLEKLSPEERAKLRERFERLRELTPEQRAEMFKRLERLRVLERRAIERLGPDAREKLERMPPDIRRRVERGMLEQRMFERGRSIRDRLPEEVRAKLENASPEERRAILREFWSKERRDHEQRALEQLGRDLQLAPGEIERIQALPEQERFREVIELRRKVVQQKGPPQWMDASQWSALQDLSTPEFFERLHELQRDQDPEGGFDPMFGPGPGRRGFGGFPRPDPEWFAETSDLPPAERRAAFEARMRERILDHLAKEPGKVSPAELDALKQKQGHDFFEALRELGLEKGFGPPRRGDRRDGDRHGGQRGPPGERQ